MLPQRWRSKSSIAGPCVNFERTLNNFSSGDYSARVHLRKGDLLFDVADRVNELLEWAQYKLPEQETSGSEPAGGDEGAVESVEAVEAVAAVAAVEAVKAVKAVNTADSELTS